MKTPKLLFVTLILGLFQLVFLRHLTIFGACPDFLLIVVVIAGLFLKMRWAVIFGASVGMFKDIFSLSSFGLNILLFSCWSFMVVKISRKVSIEDNMIAVLLVFLIALLQNIISGLFIFYSGASVPLGIFLRIVILGSFYTALTLPFILKVIKVRI
ncbi:MAG: rod shape-determining protein MreD [Candidatus Omnitrophica bacterium]|nr:rod shape-determining protein MreD [Candidatus Omnitrophota bacterium]